MTRDQLKEFLGVTGKVGADKIIDGLSAKELATYERMAEVETELHLWQQGVGPKPPGVIICGPRQVRRR